MKKIVSASFLCGSLTRKKHPAQNPIDNSEGEDPDSSDTQQQQLRRPAPSDQEQPLRPPPGRGKPHHVRATSYGYHHQRSRSSSAVSRLTSSLSMKMRQSSRREDKNNKSELEDSVWKKTIILGEKCRVPDEDDDTVLYDEKGKKISTYHPKNGRSAGSFSRQNSATDRDSIFDPPRLFGSSSGKNRSVGKMLFYRPDYIGIFVSGFFLYATEQAFSLYKEWKEIIGQDRANGEATHDLGSIVHQVLRNERLRRDPNQTQRSLPKQTTNYINKVDDDVSPLQRPLHSLQLPNRPTLNNTTTKDYIRGAICKDNGGLS